MHLMPIVTNADEPAAEQNFADEIPGKNHSKNAENSDVFDL
jgi:hypothetical protein